MSVDTVNYALTKVRRSIELHPDTHSPEGRRKLLTMCGVMRDYLIVNDVASFDGYIDLHLANAPDAMGYLLEELFEQLGFGDEIGTRDQLSAELAA